MADKKEQKPDDRFRPPGWAEKVAEILETAELQPVAEIGELFAEAMLESIRSIGVDAVVLPNHQIIIQVSKVIIPGKTQFIGTPMQAQGDYVGPGRLSFIQAGRASNMLVKLA